MTETILLIDDDQIITEGLGAALQCEGRTIITCNDIESAELIVERLHPSHVVTDVRLSGPFAFEGLDFVRFVRRHAPESRVVLMSGQTSDAIRREATERGAVALLSKPFGIGELDAVLDMSAPPSSIESMVEHPVIRVPLLEELLGSKDLRPFFQPIVSLDGAKRVIGYESLARFRTDSPLCNPEMMFRYAARKRRVIDLELACLAATMRAATSLPATASIFVNVHPFAFHEEACLVEHLERGLANSGLAAGRFVVEITEQAPLPAGPGLVNTIAAIRNLGMRFAFDDVGVAYSHLPFMDLVRPAYLKISQDFGSDFEKDATRTKIVKNIASLAADFGCQTILEGIEEPSTARAAELLDIPLGQGYLFGRPMDVCEPIAA
jgi:EAL domain-containing protein (putative c-di-GMP-specific phosphodiesterase class I)/ActR/RegA family two-component response regulator